MRPGVQEHLQNLVRDAESRASGDPQAVRGGVYVVRGDGLAAEERVLLHTAARAVVASAQGNLVEQLLRVRHPVTAVREPALAPPAARGREARRAAGALLQRARRIHAGRPRIRDRAGEGPADAVAVDQRRRQSGVRLPGVRVGRRLHVGGEQPREPVDAVVERPGVGAAGRGASTCRILRPARYGRRQRCRSASTKRATSRASARATRDSRASRRASAAR